MPAEVRPAESQAARDGVAPAASRTIGDIISETRNLTAEQVEQILRHQREKGVRFGEAAVALGLASSDDVLFALSQQFHYPYVPQSDRSASKELVTLNQPFSRQAEAFRTIRSQLMMRLAFESGAQRKALAVVSTSTGDGKTFFAANLAVALAQLGARTLAVDADMRDPRLHDVFGLANGSGLSGILAGRPETRAVQQVAHVPGLFVLSAGVIPPNPLELIERPAFGLLMRELVSKFDHVVLDTPSADQGSDAAVIAARAGSALVVTRKDRSRVGAVRHLISDLAATPAALAGVVVNEY
jgi:chain length determinant protein tyrosine kinase EpsG